MQWCHPWPRSGEFKLQLTPRLDSVTDTGSPHKYDTTHYPTSGGSPLPLLVIQDKCCHRIPPPAAPCHVHPDQIHLPANLVQPFHKRSSEVSVPPVLLLLWWLNRVRLSFDANVPLRVWAEPRKIRVYLKVVPGPPHSRSPGATINVSALSVATTPPCHLHLYQSQTWNWCLKMFGIVTILCYGLLGMLVH